MLFLYGRCEEGTRWSERSVDCFELAKDGVVWKKEAEMLPGKTLSISGRFSFSLDSIGHR